MHFWKRSLNNVSIKRRRSSFLRKLILPADDWSAEEDEVKTICNAIMTTERINAYKAARAAETPPGAPE